MAVRTIGGRQVLELPESEVRMREGGPKHCLFILYMFLFNSSILTGTSYLETLDTVSDSPYLRYAHWHTLPSCLIFTLFQQLKSYQDGY